MIKIPAIHSIVPVLDNETGLFVDTDSISPAVPFPITMIRVECDGEFYTVFEEGDI